MTFRPALLICCCLAGLVHADSLTLPLDQRPEWLSRDGIVMAGSWEPLLFRVRRDGSEGYTPTPEQREAYLREHSPEMVAQLKAMGVNFVMMHCYKAFGLQAERESMADAVRFAKLCHEAGMRVGVYNNSGTLGWELFFKELPQAKDWVVLDHTGKPVTYGRATYRYYWNRNHPDAQAFYRNIINFSVNQIKTDLIHFDNYIAGPGWDPVSIERFRRYLRETFTTQQREQAGIKEVDAVQPPAPGSPDGLLRRAWLDFSCQSMADSYVDLSRYARSLRKDILMEVNPGGPGERIHSPIDHGRLLQGGEAFWDEGVHPSFQGGKLVTRIRTYKVARTMNNIAFAYAINPLEMAESMAFNRDSLGCICWFEYNKLVALPGSTEPVSPDLAPFIGFFNARRDLLRDANVIADVAVLRSFPSQVFADPKHAQLAARVEQTLIENRACFDIIYDRQLNDLKRYRALVLAGSVALSDPQVDLIGRYVDAGGKLCIVGPAATHDQWLLPRPQPALDDLPSEKIVRIAEQDDPLPAIRRACDDKPSMVVDGPPGLCAELTEQPTRRLVHLVNYRPDGPVKEVKITVRLPQGKPLKSATLACPKQAQAAKLEFNEQSGTVTLTVPAIDVYGIVVLTLGS